MRRQTLAPETCPACPEKLWRSMWCSSLQSFSPWPVPAAFVPGCYAARHWQWGKLEARCSPVLLATQSSWEEVAGAMLCCWWTATSRFCSDCKMFSSELCFWICLQLQLSKGLPWGTGVGKHVHQPGDNRQYEWLNPPFCMDDCFLVFHTLLLKKCSGFLKVRSCGFIRVIRKQLGCYEMCVMRPAWAKRIRDAGVCDVQKSFIKAASHVAILSWDVQAPCSVTCMSLLRGGGRARMEKENLTERQV